MSDTGNLNLLWASLMVEQFVRNGVTQFYGSPGSRSTPLTVAIARHPKAELHMHFDERGSAFRALGYARATGGPAVWVTTSGTAVANGYPAVVEASMDQVPLICLTADRPPELRDCGANQTIDQVKIFGDYVAWFFDLPCPTPEIEPGFVTRRIHEAVMRSESGPVHLNAMFREPFLPGQSPSLPAVFITSLNREQPASFNLAPESVDHWLQLERGIILAGRMPAWGPEIPELASLLGWPVFPDLLSGLRAGGESGEGPQGIDGFDSILLSSAFTERHPPEVVLHLGGGMISKRSLQWLDQVDPEHHIVVAPEGVGADPGHRATQRLAADPAAACRALTARARKLGLDRDSHENEWLQVWKEADDRAGEALNEVIQAQGLCEPWVARHLCSATTCSVHHPHWALFVASSMPVRDVDGFGILAEDRGVAANRGASGIDGTVASAFGFAEGRKQPVLLLIGDLALLHDLNSLALLNDSAWPVIVVVINNDGGGIFSFLPIAEQADVFESCFGTPHGLTFESAASMFGLPYHHPESTDDFERALRQAMDTGTSALIEVSTEREHNVQVHRDIQAAVRAALQ